MLFHKVIRNGYCIGCGACAAFDPKRYVMRMQASGLWQATPLHTQSTNTDTQAQSVCPFADNVPTTADLSRDLYPDALFQHDIIGRFQSLWCGHVTDEQLRSRRTSGGITQWLLVRLLQTGAVDYIVHVAPSSDADVRVAYTISATPEELQRNAKSAYYPVEMSQVLNTMRERPGRYAVVASQSYCTALRLLARQDPIWQERIAYCIGIITAQQKSAHYADVLQWQLAPAQSRAQEIDFRVKNAHRQANVYDVAVKQQRVHRASVATLLGTNWSTGYLHAPADDYSADVFAETADIAIGDAWNAPEKYDSGGNNVVIVRHQDLHDMLEEGRQSNALALRSAAVETVLESQRANIRHRRDGLAVRVARKRQQGKWYPPLQIPLSLDAIPKRQQEKYRRREDINAQSFAAFAKAKPKRSVAQFFLGVHRATLHYAVCLPWKKMVVVLGHMYVALCAYYLRSICSWAQSRKCE